MWFSRLRVAFLVAATESGKAVCRVLHVDGVPVTAANVQAYKDTHTLGNSKRWPSKWH